MTSGNHSSQELSTVLDSLSKLADLEQRISGLERENQYDKLLTMEVPPAHQRSSIEFRKKRVPAASISGGQDSTGIPLGISYEIRYNKKQPNNNNSSSWKVRMPMGGRGAAGAGSVAVRNKQQQQNGYGNNKEEDNDRYDNDNEEERYDRYGNDDNDGNGPGIFITATQNNNNGTGGDAESTRR